MVSLTETLAVQWSFLTALGRIHFLSLSLFFFFSFLRYECLLLPTLSGKYFPSIFRASSGEQVLSP